MIDRLQKKCIVASVGIHSLLIGLLLFGSALMPKPQEAAFVPIKVYDSKDVSMAESSGGGSPDVAVAPNPPAAVQPVQPQPTPVKPQPEPPKTKPVEPTPVPELPKIVHRDTAREHVPAPKVEKTKPKPVKEDADETPKLAHKIEIPKDSLKPVTRNKEEKADQSQAAADAKTRADRKRIAKQISTAYNTIGKTFSSSTPVEIPGVGGPGPVTVNYGSIISSKYSDAWRPPLDVDESLATAEASVTIARDGSVISAHITKSSGNASLDRSIENALSAVTFIEPFPPSFKQQQITVTFPFNLRTKRQTG